jgi:hypothetical protein
MLARLDLRVLAAVVVLSIAGSSVPSEATVITYGVAALAGNTFEYRYVVDNETLSPGASYVVGAPAAATVTIADND